MNDDLRLTDELLHDMFERRARRGSSDGLRGSILSMIRTTEQRRFPGRILADGRPALRLLAVAAILAGSLGTGLLIAGQRQSPPPAQHFSRFAPEFDFRPVDGFPSGPPILRGNLLGFTVSAPGARAVPSDAPPGTEMYPRSDSGEYLPDAHGITIGSLYSPLTHTCQGNDRYLLPTDPAGFLDDLGAIAGAGLDSPRKVTFDGRPALEANVDPTEGACHSVDYHPTGSLTGLSRAFADLGLPSRLIVTDVGGRTIVLQVWAATPEGLEAWLPTATRFLDGIHFTDPTDPRRTP